MSKATGIPERMRGAMLLGPERIEVREVPVPIPGRGELLLRIGAATTCGTDVKVYRRGGHPRMLAVPTLFGHEMAGTVAAAGPGAESFGVGDRVVVVNSAPCATCERCRSGQENLCEDLEYLNGAFAEFLLVPARFVRTSTRTVPDGLTLEKAALTEPLACVLHGIDACELHSRYQRDGGAEVVVFGAGPIGLLFVAALRRDHHQVTLADPNPGRLEVGAALGASRCVLIDRNGSAANKLRSYPRARQGADVAIDCTGAPAVWSAAMAAVRPGGLVNLFGGCAPGTEVVLDTHRIHYDELTVKGVYHHRPATVDRALELLGQPDFAAERLLTDVRPIEGVEEALRSMMNKEALKVVIRG